MYLITVNKDINHYESINHYKSMKRFHTIQWPYRHIPVIGCHLVHANI